MTKVHPSIPKFVISAAPEDEDASGVGTSLTSTTVESNNPDFLSAPEPPPPSERKKKKTKVYEGADDDSGDEDSVSIQGSIPEHEFYHTHGREKWWNHKDCLLLIVGTCVGTSNLGTFPMDVLEHGGVAYFLPYSLMLFLYSFPVIYLELIIGQYLQRGVLGIWRICPLFKGIGIAMLIFCTATPIFFVVQLSWFMALLVRVTAEDPKKFLTCQESWNTRGCTKVDGDLNRTQTQGKSILVTEEFYRLEILKEELKPSGRPKYDLDDLGHTNETLALYVILMYVFAFLALAFSHRVNGKLAWMTAVLPSLCLATLLFRGSSLPGSFQGMEFLMKPNLTKIQEGWKPWETACVHSVFSTAAGNGVHLTFASYNKFDRPILRWAFTAVCVDFLVSVISTLLVFTFVGSLSFTLQKTLEETTAILGKGNVIFESFPGIIGGLPAARFFGFAFYFLVLQIGLDNITGYFEVFITGFMDENLEFFGKHKHGRLVFVFIVVTIAALASLVCVSPGGVNIYLMLSTGFGGVGMTIAGVFFGLVITSIYGTVPIRNAIVAMGGHTYFFVFFQICWALGLLGQGVFLYKYIKESFEGSNYPRWYDIPLPKSAVVITYCFSYTPLLAIPIYAIYKLFKIKAETPKVGWVLAISPEHEHRMIVEAGTGPRLLCIPCCGLYYIFRDRSLDYEPPQDQAVKEASSTSSTWIPLPAPPSKNPEDDKVDSNANPKPVPSNDSSYTIEPAAAEQDGDADTDPHAKNDLEVVSAFMRKGKRWKDMPLEK